MFLQAGCWGVMSLVAIYWAVTTKSAPPGGIPLWHHPGWDFGVAAMCGALTGAKARLGTRISHPSGGTRWKVIVVECLMVGFAVVLCLLTFNLDGGSIPFCAGAVGGIMSLVAAILLTRPRTVVHAALYSGAMRLTTLQQFGTGPRAS